MKRENMKGAGEPVRRYLMSLISQGGKTPVKIPAERDLAEMLGLSRGTVRRAITDLEEARFLMRLPGRKGAFTDPRSSRMLMASIGVVMEANWFEHRRLIILKSFSDALTEQKVNHSFSFEFRRGMDDETFAETLRYGGHTLLLVIQTETASFPESSFGFDKVPVIRYDAVRLFDHEYAGEIIAEFFLRRKCRKVIFWCVDNLKRESFLRHLAENGAECIECCNQLNEPLSKIGKSKLKSADGIFISGTLHNGIYAALDYLAKIKSRIPVLLRPLEEEDQLKAEYPTLDVHCLSHVAENHALYQAAWNLGCQAADILSGRPVREIPKLRHYEIECNMNKQKFAGMELLNQKEGQNMKSGENAKSEKRTERSTKP